MTKLQVLQQVNEASSEGYYPIPNLKAPKEIFGDGKEIAVTCTDGVLLFATHFEGGTWYIKVGSPFITPEAVLRRLEQLYEEQATQLQRFIDMVEKEMA